MTPADIVDLAKRTAHIGVPGNNSDQVALDLLKCLTNHRFAFWRFHDWDWSLDDISLSVGPSTYNQTFPATTGELMDLGIVGESGRLRRYTRRQYLEWQKRPNVTDSGNLVGYIPLGRDSSGNLKVRFFAAPTTAVTVSGWAKKRISALTVADWTTDLVYFPVETHDILYKLVLSDAYAMREDPRSGPEASSARTMMKNLAGDEDSPADDDPQAEVPDYIKFVNRGRGGGTKVV